MPINGAWSAVKKPKKKEWSACIDLEQGNPSTFLNIDVRTGGGGTFFANT